MRNIDEGLEELKRFTDEACAGALTEERCRARFAEFKKQYGDLVYEYNLGAIKNEPASKEKLLKLRSIQAQGGTSEDVFLEMARTGRKLRKKKTVGIVAVITSIVAVVAIIALIVSLCRE